MHQPARSPYVSVLLLMGTAVPQRCSGWNLAQRPWSEGNCKPWPLWKASVPTALLQTLQWLAEHPGQRCSEQHNNRTAPGTWPGNMPGSALQVELLTLASCSLCGRTSTPSSCLTNTGIVNNTIMQIASWEKKTHVPFLNIGQSNLKKVDGHIILNESHLTCHLNPSVWKNYVNNNYNEIRLIMHAWAITPPQKNLLQ